MHKEIIIDGVVYVPKKEYDDQWKMEGEISGGGGVIPSFDNPYQIQKFKPPFELDAGMKLYVSPNMVFEIIGLSEEGVIVTTEKHWSLLDNKINWNTTAQANNIPWKDGVMYDYLDPYSKELFNDQDNVYCVNLIGEPRIASSSEGTFINSFAYFKEESNAINFRNKIFIIKKEPFVSINEIENSLLKSDTIKDRVQICHFLVWYISTKIGI